MHVRTSCSIPPLTPWSISDEIHFAIDRAGARPVCLRRIGRQRVHAAANDGRFVLPVSAANWDEATALLRQADGKLILSGWVYSGNSSAGDFGALPCRSTGTIDSTFRNAGITIQPMAAGAKNDLAHAAVLQPDESACRRCARSSRARPTAATTTWH
jgi:hypothetical protein